MAKFHLEDLAEVVKDQVRDAAKEGEVLHGMAVGVVRGQEFNLEGVVGNAQFIAEDGDYVEVEVDDFMAKVYIPLAEIEDRWTARKFGDNPHLDELLYENIAFVVAKPVRIEGQRGKLFAFGSQKVATRKVYDEFNDLVKKNAERQKPIRLQGKVAEINKRWHYEKNVDPKTGKKTKKTKIDESHILVNWNNVEIKIPFEWLSDAFESQTIEIDQVVRKGQNIMFIPKRLDVEFNKEGERSVTAVGAASPIIKTGSREILDRLETPKELVHGNLLTYGNGEEGWDCEFAPGVVRKLHIQGKRPTLEETRKGSKVVVLVQLQKGNGDTTKDRFVYTYLRTVGK
jgi:hypothetical protein